MIVKSMYGYSVKRTVRSKVSYRGESVLNAYFSVTLKVPQLITILIIYQESCYFPPNLS